MCFTMASFMAPGRVAHVTLARQRPGTPATMPPHASYLDHRGRPARPNAPVLQEQPVPALRTCYENLLKNCWKPIMPCFVMKWCGHGTKYVRWLHADELWLLVPMLEERGSLIS